MMEVSTFPIPGPLLLKPRVFADGRGWFQETYNRRGFREATGIDADFVQDNESLSHRGVLRGLHFQLDPYAQGKLVRVLNGAVLDVIVDLRRDSPTHGRHLKLELTATAREALWIPPGFAHGFLALMDHTLFAYKCTNYYHQPSERTIRWNDPDLDIDWGIGDPVVSAKDRDGFAFRGAWDQPC
jgi:dTDP-4-dehydrorhamnose 3,5-epimerase